MFISTVCLLKLTITFIFFTILQFKIPFVDAIHTNVKFGENHEKISVPNNYTMRLLKDSEITAGEFGTRDNAAEDVIIKYDTKMYGYVDSEPVLHVWTAPFSRFGEIWPHPKKIRTIQNIYAICTKPNDFNFRIAKVTNYIIDNAIIRYRKLICLDKNVSFYPNWWGKQERLLDNAIVGQQLFESVKGSIPREQMSSDIYRAVLNGVISTVVISVIAEGDPWPSLSMDESYQIRFNNNEIHISAPETWGALRALESLSQLVWRTKSGKLFINETQISDQPRFRHRGLMLDTARHFMPKSVILKNLDAMAMNKMNVFHWHITDDQSFPLLLKSHPEFAKRGAYNPVNKVYTTDDVKEIVEYARARGIRVIPEIDNPSHSLVWRHSHPEIMTRCIDTSTGRWNGYYGPLNMISESTYRILEDIFRELIELFPDKWVHLGSDEVATGCVGSNPAIQKWMRLNNIKTVEMLTDFYLRRLQNSITNLAKDDTSRQRGFVVWQEAYDRNSALKKGTIVQLWKSQSTSEAVSLARQSIPVIYSACWYLDRLEYGIQWINHYACDPGDEYGGNTGNNDDNSNSWRRFILGGEAAMWTEFFDESNVLQRIWPLTGAAAERLWSPSYIHDADAAAPRMEEMRCRMIIRGIPTGVASGAGSCSEVTQSNYVQAQHQFIEIVSQKHDLSDVSTTKLIKQIKATNRLPVILTINLFHLSLMPVIFLLFIALLCIYIRISKHASTRKVTIVMFVLMTVYMFIWILSQPKFYLKNAH